MLKSTSEDLRDKIFRTLVGFHGDTEGTESMATAIAELTEISEAQAYIDVLKDRINKLEEEHYGIQR